MRRAPLARWLLVALAAGACHKPSFEPELLRDTRELDREVLELVERKVALVRAAPSDAAAHAGLGLVYEANGFWDAAEKSLAHALAIDDGQPWWTYHRALVLREAGHTDEALASLREAAQRLPASAAVGQRLGQWLLDRGDPVNARVAFERALASMPDNPECLTGLAGVSAARQQWDDSQQLARRALKVDPNCRAAAWALGLALQGLGRDEEARDFLAQGKGARSRWLEDQLTRELLGYRLSTQALSEDANRANAAREHSRAAELLERLAVRQPGDAGLLVNLAANLLELERLERADAVLKQALALAPDSAAVHLNLADLCLRRQELGLARQHADRAVELGGDIASTHFMRGRILALQKDLAGAYGEFKHAAELEAPDPQRYMALMEISVRLSQFEEARSWCRKALELDPKLLPARVNQGVLALRAGDLDEARSALAVLEKIAPAHPRTVSLRESLAKSGQ